MKAREQLRVDTLRSALTGFTYKRGETGREPTDDEELDVLRRLVKQRGDSIKEFTKAGRVELAEKERAERDVLSKYLPQQKSEEEIRAVVMASIAALPEGARNQGSAMKAIMPQLRGLADGKLVAKVVQEALAAGKSK